MSRGKRRGKAGHTRSPISTLLIHRRWVVSSVEEFDQLFVADSRFVKRHQDGFGMTSRARTDLSVSCSEVRNGHLEVDKGSVRFVIRLAGRK